MLTECLIAKNAMNVTFPLIPAQNSKVSLMPVTFPLEDLLLSVRIFSGKSLIKC